MTPESWPVLQLEGTYHVAPNKRLTLLASAVHPADLQALTQACAAQSGQCRVEVVTQHGRMVGHLTEKVPQTYRLRGFEGHLAFPARG